MTGVEIAIKILLPLIGFVITIGLAVIGHFMTRLKIDQRDLKTSIREVSDETRENRNEIHRVERRMGEEFAHKSDLSELRKEVKEGFDNTQKLIMELWRDRGE